MIVTLIGNNFGGLGLFITEGIATFFPTKVYVGAGLSVLLAIAADLSIARLERLLAPWAAAQGDAHGQGLRSPARTPAPGGYAA